MTPTFSLTLPDDEAGLGRLLCKRLGGRLEGVITIGLPGLIDGGPPPTFFEEHLAVCRAHAVILNTLGGHSDPYRKASSALLQALDVFRHAANDEETREEAFNALFDALEGCGRLLGLEPPTFARSRAACTVILAWANAQHSLAAPAV